MTANPDGLPSSEDLDKHAQELQLATQTAGMMAQQVLEPPGLWERIVKTAEEANSVQSNPHSTYRLGGITGRGFLPGQSGNPGGRAKKKPITEIFEQILDDPEKREQVAISIFNMMKSGRMAGVMMVNSAADRLEGKISQPVEVSGELRLTLAQRMERSAKQLEESD